MASLACAKARLNDATSLARAKEFLNRRHEMIWNEALWRASVYRHEFTFDPTPSALDAEDVKFNNHWFMNWGQVGLPVLVDRVLGLRKTDAGLGVAQAEMLFRSSVDEFAETGVPVKFVVLPRLVVDFDDEDISAEGLTITSDPLDAGAALLVRYLDANGEEASETVTLNVAGYQQMVAYPRAILSVTKAVTVGPISCDFDNDNVFYLYGADTAAKRYPRIQLLPKPTADTVFTVLVKKRATLLTDGGDEPELPGAENCLIAFCQADLLELDSAYAKAALVRQEAMALLEQLKSMETVQQSSSVRFVPDPDEPAGVGEWGKGWFQ
jgi:hypothetical protein